MKTIKLSKNFFLHEYIDQQTYADYEGIGKLHHLVWRLDSRLIALDQLLRDRHGAITINNWHEGGEREWSGLRTLGSTYYSPNSQHSFGRGSDKIFHDKEAKEVIQDIRDNYNNIYKQTGLRGLEVRASWVHTDVRNSSELIIFEP